MLFNLPFGSGISRYIVIASNTSKPEANDVCFTEHCYKDFERSRLKIGGIYASFIKIHLIDINVHI